MARDENVMAESFQFDTVELRPRAFQILRDGKPLALEPKAVRVLIHLVENRDRVVPKEELMTSVWGDTAVTDNALTRIIAQIRRELGDDARQPRYIQTVPTLGYRFVATLADSAAAPAPPPPRRPWGLYGAIAAGAVLLAAVALAFLGRTPAAVKAGPVRQITTSDGLDIGASFSPDGLSLAYASDRSGQFEIYVRPLAGAAREFRLTEGGQNLEPAWSPDGRWIAYHSVAKGGIWIVPASGGNARQVVDHGSQPAWSPDSTAIALRMEDAFSVSIHDVLPGASSAIGTVRIDGSGLRPLTRANSPECRPLWPTWRPDGRSILFGCRAGHGVELWTVSPTGTDLQKVENARQTAVFPVFSPDGSSVFFGSIGGEATFGIWRLPLDGRSPATEVLRTGSGTIPRHLAISRDGRQLAYSATTQTGNLWELPMDGFTPSASPKPLYRDNVFRASFPTFSPDGKRLAFFARAVGGTGDLWTIDADGRNAAQLTQSPSADLLPSWTPDGSALVYTRKALQGPELWRTSIGDRSEAPVMRGTVVWGYPRLSPDGKWMVFHTERDGRMNLWSMALSGGGEPRQLTNDAEGAGFPVWSPDGKSIAYEVIRGSTTQIALMDYQGRNQTQITNGPGQNWCFSWSPDGSKIACASFRAGVWNLQWIDGNTREQRTLTDYTSLAAYVRYPAWSPTGKHIVFEYSQTRGNIYAVPLRKP